MGTQSSEVGLYRAAVHQRLDEGIVVVGHLLIVGAQEAQRLVIIVSLGVVPGHRLMANISEVLPSGGAQQLEEGHLHCADGVFPHADVVQLRRALRKAARMNKRRTGDGVQMELSNEKAGG